jgi:hypothetical protein
VPATELKTITITWPFAVWGLDMVGPFKTTTYGYTHILVAVDKFTMWIEARPIASLSGETTTRFIKDIVIRYGPPSSIITDNGSNLSQGELELYCHHMGFWQDVALVVDPQSNGKVDRMNGLILRGIRPWLEVHLHRAAGA